MKRITRLYKFASLVCFSLIFVVSTEAEEVRIGAIASLTGAAAEQGKNWLQGAQFAAEDLKQEKIEVSLVVEDDATQPAKVNAAFEKLAGVDKVTGIIGGTWDFLAEAAVPLTRKYRIPFVTPTNPVEILSESAQKNPLVFTNGLSLKATEEAFQQVLSSLPVSSVSIIAPAVPFGVAHADMVERLARKLNIHVLSRLDFQYAGYHDTLRTAALSLSRKKPDLIFCLTDYAALNIFWREIQKYDYSPWLLTTQHLDAAVELSGQPEVWQRAIGVYPKIENREFARRFEQRFGHKPKVYSAQGYDALLFLARAIEQGISFTTDTFRTTGVTGEIVFEPGRTEVIETEAIALTIDKHGSLRPFLGEE